MFLVLICSWLRTRGKINNNARYACGNGDHICSISQLLIWITEQYLPQYFKLSKREQIIILLQLIAYDLYNKGQLPNCWIGWLRSLTFTYNLNLNYGSKVFWSLFLNGWHKSEYIAYTWLLYKVIAYNTITNVFRLHLINGVLWITNHSTFLWLSLLWVIKFLWIRIVCLTVLVYIRIPYSACIEE